MHSGKGQEWSRGKEAQPGGGLSIARLVRVDWFLAGLCQLNQLEFFRRDAFGILRRACTPNIVDHHPQEATGARDVEDARPASCRGGEQSTRGQHKDRAELTTSIGTSSQGASLSRRYPCRDYRMTRREENSLAQAFDQA